MHSKSGLRQFRLGVLCLGALWLAGCSALIIQPSLRACYFPDDTASATPAPTWVCDAALPGVSLSAVGAASGGAGGYAELKARAIHQARRGLARQARADLYRRVTIYAQHQARSVPGAQARIAYSLRRYLRPGTLSGALVYRTAVSSRGALYVLLGFNARAAQARMRDALSASINTDAALWRRYLPATSLSGLAQRILSAR